MKIIYFVFKEIPFLIFLITTGIICLKNTQVFHNKCNILINIYCISFKIKRDFVFFIKACLKLLS